MKRVLRFKLFLIDSCLILRLLYHIRKETGTCKVLKKERNFVSDILTFIFDMERALLQPASQKNQDIYKVSLILQDLDINIELTLPIVYDIKSFYNNCFFLFPIILVEILKCITYRVNTLFLQ